MRSTMRKTPTTSAASPTRVYDANGKVIASLGTSTIIMQLDKALLPKIVEMVKDSAKKVSKSLGFAG